MSRVREQRSPQIRRQLMESTIRLFNQYGARVTTEAICQDAGVGKGTLFNYFATKENLLYETYLYCHQHAGDITEENIDWAADVETVVKQLLRQATRWAFSFPQEVIYTTNYYRTTQTDLLNVDERSPVKGFIDDGRILSRLMKLAPLSIPPDYLRVAISTQNYQLCIYLAQHPELKDNPLFVEHVIEWIWRSIDTLRFIH